MPGTTNYIVRLTSEEQDVAESELAGVIERNEVGDEVPEDWNPTEWKALLSAQRKIANAKPDRGTTGRGGTKSSRGPSGSGLRGIRG
jgi:hypothetical protein